MEFLLVFFLVGVFLEGVFNLGNFFGSLSAVYLPRQVLDIIRDLPSGSPGGGRGPPALVVSSVCKALQKAFFILTPCPLVIAADHKPAKLGASRLALQAL